MSTLPTLQVQEGFRGFDNFTSHALWSIVDIRQTELLVPTHQTSVRCTPNLDERIELSQPIRGCC